MPTNSEQVQAKCPPKVPPEYTRTFAEVYLAELDYIKKRRIKMGIPSDTIKPLETQSENDVKPSVQTGLVGLALSGGGVRSATFNLGILQSLAKNKVLQHCDYLSTVSGGGYIGSCLSSLLAQKSDVSTKPEEFPLRSQCGSESNEVSLTSQDDGKEERAEVKYLCQNANYLGLGRGFTNWDFWQVTERVVFGILLTNLALVGLIGFIGFGLYFIIFSPIFSHLMTSMPFLKDVNVITITTITTLLLLVGFGFYFLKSKLLFTLTMLIFIAGVSHVSDWVLLRYSILLAAFVLFFVIFLVHFCQVAFFHKSRLLTGRWIDVLTAIMYIFLFPLFLLMANYLSNSKTMNSEPLSNNMAATSYNYFPTIINILGIAILFIFIGTIIAKNRSTKKLLEISWRAIFIAMLTTTLIFSLGLLFYDVFTSKDFVSFVSLVSDIKGLVSDIKEKDPVSIFIIMMIFLLAIFINTNYTSLHCYYRDRLSKTYLIKRVNKGIVSDDSLKLTDLHDHHNGPYHLINTTLNVPSSKNPSLKGRGADFFLFSKYYCGAQSTGYRKTKSYAKGQTRLATAMAISGAAASPIMGPSTNPIMAFLMTLLNVRLNFWMPNPNLNQTSKLIIWPFYLLKELFHQGTEKDVLLNLSDGGHIENLGVYPLLKRRCRLIIASDASADPDYQMEDFFILLRKAHTDLGINIRLDLCNLQPDEKNRYTRTHFIKGTIHYPDNETGVLYYLKTSMTGQEPEDLLKYRNKDSSFPDQTTADQFFGTEQFESYRKLGEFVGNEMRSKKGKNKRGKNKRG
jgi:hypothetical protein